MLQLSLAQVFNATTIAGTGIQCYSYVTQSSVITLRAPNAACIGVRNVKIFQARMTVKKALNSCDLGQLEH
jgi:hypothetical protein